MKIKCDKANFLARRCYTEQFCSMSTCPFTTNLDVVTINEKVCDCRIQVRESCSEPLDDVGEGIASGLFLL